jgi:SAM-dependent methyltransferase
MKSYTSTNQSTYDLVAQNYTDEHQQLEWEQELRKFIHYIQTEKPVIVDLGSGPGNEAKWIRDELPHSDVYAVDISAEMIKLASANSSRVTCIQDDIVTFKPRYYADAIWARASIHHLTSEEIYRLFDNINSYLNTNGIIGMVNKYGKDEEIEEKKKYGKTIKRFFHYIDEDFVHTITTKYNFSLLEQKIVTTDHKWLVTFLRKG